MSRNIRVVGYGRISQTNSEEEDTSLQNQKQEIVRHCEENGYRLVGWFQDANVSGSTDPFGREEFGELVEKIKEDPLLSTILIRKGNRLSRGKSIDDIEQRFYDRHGVDVDIIMVNPTGLQKVVQEFKQSDDGTKRAAAVGMEGQMKMIDQMKIEEAREASKNMIKERRLQGLPVGCPPRGVKIEDDEWKPIEEHEEHHKEFSTVISALNEYHTTDKSKYRVGNQFDIPSPCAAFDLMLDRLDVYRQVAEEHTDLEAMF
ncbi:recombinase family protein [Natronococcus wangiae]|uniref:recombinase family protein n=1 Tax=Natronococcus wangiae TaxID=3068275 RepID=UPI00273DDA7C|nr:recombinase family protein [Natronococcus sp. AD5]